MQSLVLHFFSFFQSKSPYTTVAFSSRKTPILLQFSPVEKSLYYCSFLQSKNAYTTAVFSSRKTLDNGKINNICDFEKLMSLHKSSMFIKLIAHVSSHTFRTEKNITCNFFQKKLYVRILNNYSKNIDETIEIAPNVTQEQEEALFNTQSDRVEDELEEDERQALQPEDETWTSA